MHRRRRILAALMVQVLFVFLAVPAYGVNPCRRVTSAEDLEDGRYVLLFSDGSAPATFHPEHGLCLPAYPRQTGQDTLLPQSEALWQLTFCQDNMGVTLRSAEGSLLAPAAGGGLAQGQCIWQLHATQGVFSLSARVGEETFWLVRDSRTGSFGSCMGENPEGDVSFFLYQEAVENSAPVQTQVQQRSPSLPEQDSFGRHWYLGQLHGHSSYSGSGDFPGQIFARIRAGGELDFYALTDYVPGLTGSRWQTGRDAAQNAATEDFLPLWGYETFSLPEEQTGHFGVLGTDSLVEEESLAGCYEALLSAAGALGQFNHPGTEYGNFRDFSGHSLEADAVMQLLEVGDRKGRFREEEYVRALDAGWHIGPTAGQDGGSGGTMLLAEELTEESVLSALKSRRVYATQDRDLHIDFSVSGHPMGSVLRYWDLGQEPTVRLSLYDPTDTQSMQVEVIARGGLPAASYSWEGSALNFSLPSGSDWYYLKITQADGDVALTAPVWIDWREYAGISGFSLATQQPVQNQQAELILELFNQEEVPLQITAIALTGDGESLLNMGEAISIPAGQTQSIPLTIRCPARAQTRLRVSVTARQGGLNRQFESSLTLACREESPFVTIRALKQEQPGFSFQIRGRVTASELFPDMLMVQDGTGAIAVTPVDTEGFAPGDQVEIQGFSRKQDGLWLINPVSVEKCADSSYLPHPEELVPGQVLPDSPVMGMLVTVQSTCVSGADGAFSLQCPGGNPIPVWTEAQRPPEAGKTIRVTGILWKKDGQTGVFLRSLTDLEVVEESSAQESTGEKSAGKKAGKKQVTYRETENPDVGDPLPRWLIWLMMRKEMLWNCTIR